MTGSSFQSWFDAALSAPWVLGSAWLSITAYFVGRRRLRGRSRRLASTFTTARATSFVLAWGLLLVAVASPLDLAAERLLSWHMVQHLLLAMVVPPLFWLAAPALPLIAGVPRSIRVGIVGPVLAGPAVRRSLGILGHPVTGWTAMAVTTLGWHVPVLYELAIADPFWHRVEHLSMLLAGVLFWRPVVASRPFRDRWPRLAMVPYLVTADIVNTVVAATLAFGPAPLYVWYGPIADALGVDPRLDQQLAAGIMWIPGNLVYLVPAMVIAARQVGLGGGLGRVRPEPAEVRGRTISLTVLPSRSARGREGGDLLEVPGVGRWLRSRGFRLGVRVVAAVALIAIVVDGFVGSERAPLNLAGTLPWTHWRGLVIVVAIVAGNVACFGCPLIAPRSLLRRWIRPTATWPRVLRSKWLATGLVVAWLVAYEALDPWDAPAMTAWILVGFVVVATAVDLIFEGASFCRYVCPLGQFQMAASTMSTRTIAARDPATCERCTTRDCLEGGPRGEGCGLGLLVPAKRGNLDCTFCLDCVTACPHDNVGILAATPGADLVDTRPRSGLRTITERPDLAMLVLAITIGGLVNAAGMTAPVVEWFDRVQAATGAARGLVEGGATLLGILVGAAFVLLMSAAPFARIRGTGDDGPRSRFGRIAVSTLPIGIAVWLVHFGFHLVTGWPTGEAALTRVAHDLGVVGSGPAEILSCCVPPPPWLLPVELLVLSIGLAGSLGVAWWIDRDRAGRTRGDDSFVAVTLRWSWTAFVPLAMWVLAAWMVFQPMEMRGTSGFAS